VPSVVATAPTRICDCGGWTDTWFAGHGAVLHIAITPGVRVKVDAATSAVSNPPVVVHLDNYGESYSFTPGRLPGRHPLIEAAVATCPVPGMALDVTVSSDMPPGASTGTSASLAVALLAALAHLRGESTAPGDLARSAHRLETGRLGLQSGIQDQIAASYGGINFIEMPSYPDAAVSPLAIRQETRIALEERLVLVYLGRAHRSSEVHEDVIRTLRDGTSHVLDMLRGAASLARGALLRGDLEAFGAALVANTEAQRQLHPSLVGADASRLVELAASVGALGWKVNGAGGKGGSIAVLLGDSPDGARAALLDRLGDVSPDARRIRMHLAPSGAATESAPE
jgi:D-glycero-alpha-D-manno-heptose-7-phosphate kinase